MVGGFFNSSSLDELYVMFFMSNIGTQQARNDFEQLQPHTIEVQWALC